MSHDITEAEALAVDEVLDSDATAAFFAPVNNDALDLLLAQYNQARQRIDQLAGLVNGELGDVVHYFIEGNAGDERFHRSVYVDKLFRVEGAVEALNAAFWSKAMNLTDVYDLMPQARRAEWSQSIREQTTPEFTEETVRSTMLSLLHSRQKFFAERVDGIFRSLSRHHVTNAPEGFSKRMIISGVLCEWGYPQTGPCGHINDLRAVIARFMGRDEPEWRVSETSVKAALAQRGEWLSLDGGALRLRVYKAGTAHLEVHPDMAWRLNQVLASLHPAAIPTQFRTRPTKRLKNFTLLRDPLPFAVLQRLDAVVPHRIYSDDRRKAWDVPNTLAVPVGERNNPALDRVHQVLRSIGGVRHEKGYYQFDYDPADVVRDIVQTGCIPDVVSHQFYATRPAVAQVCVEFANIGENDSVLEPSAGNGDLASHLPRERTTCVEISALRCSVLKARGFDAVQADFLTWAPEAVQGNKRFDCIVMNPPFSEGRALAHLKAAATLLADEGRLVAVLPGSMRSSRPLEGFDHHWSEPISDQFEGTGVTVAVLLAQRSAR